MLINMYKQQKIILLKRIMTGILVACLMIINNNADKAYAENNYNESEQVVNVGITTDKSLYSANDDMSVTVTLTNYDNQFYGDITTMIVQLDYDESVITPYADTVKNVADKNSSMGFSHVDVSKSGSITYQYIDVGEALHKNSPVLFSLKFKVNDSIASSDLIKGLIKAARIVMQDGSKQESVRYATSVDYIVDKSADSVANDDTIGLKEYDSLGELLSDDEQKDIQKNAVESKQAEEKNTQKVANNKSNNNDIGYFHQCIFKYIDKCRVPQNGKEGGWDVIFEDKDNINIQNVGTVSRVYVEMKNKHNTMNSASAGKTYIKMQSQLLDDDDCACFLVEAIAQRSQNIKWETTVDQKRVSHRRIRRVSLDQFYALVTGEQDAFYQMCMILPEVISDVVTNSESKVPHDTVLEELKNIANTVGEND